MIYTQQLHWHHLLIYVVFLPFSAFLTLLSQSHFTGYLSYSSNSAIPVMVNHVCTSELSADLGRSFSKRKNYGGNFHSWSSHLTSGQHSSCLTLCGSSWQRWVCPVLSDTLLQKPLAVSGGEHSWIQTSLHLSFL